MTCTGALTRCGATGVALMLCTAAAADDAADFARYLESKAHRDLRAAVATRHMRIICPDMPELADGAIRTEPVQPVTMAAGDSWPAAGVWIERLEGAGCGDGRQINLIFAAQGPDTPPTGVAMFPGTTRANWFLQQQSMRPAAVAASKKAPRTECRRYAVADTDGGKTPPREPGFGDSWTERWRVRACDDFVEITVTFSVRPQGGIEIEAE